MKIKPHVGEHSHRAWPSHSVQRRKLAGRVPQVLTTQVLCQTGMPFPHLPVLEICLKAWSFDAICILMAILELICCLSTASFLSESNALSFGDWQMGVLVVGSKLAFKQGIHSFLKKVLKTNQQKTSVTLGKTLPDTFGHEYVLLMIPFRLLKRVSLSRQIEQD